MINNSENFKVINSRLINNSLELENISNDLNKRREEIFGQSKREIIGRTQIETNLNCVLRDAIVVNDILVVGHNAHSSVRNQVSINDIVSTYKLCNETENPQIISLDITETFFNDDKFTQDFNELYQFYKYAKLLNISVQNRKFLLTFQIGKEISDVKVFRWQINRDNSLTYIDGLGDSDYKMPAKFDFEWKSIEDSQINRRENIVKFTENIYFKNIDGNISFIFDDGSVNGKNMINETVTEKRQKLDDMEFKFSVIGNLCLVSYRPYRENTVRFYVINSSTHTGFRNDNIGLSTRTLPENQGIIFPGGGYLTTDQNKTFNSNMQGFVFYEQLSSPNGEDLMYVFYNQKTGEYSLQGYSLISRNLDNPILGHGYGIFNNGNMGLFRTEDDSEETTLHPMQIWKTSFYLANNAPKQKESNDPIAIIGNQEIVRFLSDISSINSRIKQENFTRDNYENIIKEIIRLKNKFYWIQNKDNENIVSTLDDTSSNAESAIQEFDKILQQKITGEKRTKEAVEKTKRLISRISADNFSDINNSLTYVQEIRQQKGNLINLKKVNYVDVILIEESINDISKLEIDSGVKIINLLSGSSIIDDFANTVNELMIDYENESIRNLKNIEEEINDVISKVDVIINLSNEIPNSDPEQISEILKKSSTVYTIISQSKARITQKIEELNIELLKDQFENQYTLLSQSISHGVSSSKTINDCNNQQSRIIAQIEEMESTFSEVENFINKINDKREEAIKLFESKRQTITNEIQRRIKSIHENGLRLIENVKDRASRFENIDSLNGFFASDAIINRLQNQIEQLQKFNATVQAEDLRSKVRAVQDQSISTLRDQIGLLEDNGNIIKLGNHKFTVNREKINLSVVPNNNGLNFHINGTDYYEISSNQEFMEFKDCWQMDRYSENASVYRAEYLAYKTMTNLGSMEYLESALNDGKLEAELNKVIETDYNAGLEKGIHDHDALLIIKEWVLQYNSSDFLSIDPINRTIALVLTSVFNICAIELNKAREKSITLGLSSILEHTKNKYKNELILYISSTGFQLDYDIDKVMNAMSLIAKNDFTKEVSIENSAIINEINNDIFINYLNELSSDFFANYNSIINLLKEFKEIDIDQAIELIYTHLALNSKKTIEIDFKNNSTINGLLGRHELLNNGSYKFDIINFKLKMDNHFNVTIPRFNNFIIVKNKIIEQVENSLRMEELIPKPLTSFVRNKLVNDVYLPVVGNNFAKQIGTADNNRRTDLNGMLLLVSPPGYGKTTLVEYIANRMGMVFMKINCPTLGHSVKSLDPADTDNAGAKQELEKINLAFEMGNNVLLYLDDIQHTSAEFLQRFISLCDGTRRVEGVWKGNSKTYDMRGRKFAIIMAGNPYTETGEVFKIPDMLANRADVYNMGDMLNGQEDAFKSSYVENCLSSNKTLSILTTKSQQDVLTFMDIAYGNESKISDLEFQYSNSEINEITSTLKNLFKVRDIVLKVNLQYISSASQRDNYRTEPPFKLQGSYRNMNKLAERVVPVMNDSDILNLIIDHYRGESQTLTTGAEENILKLKEIMGILTEEETLRWITIKADFVRLNTMGDDSDGYRMIANQISILSSNIKEMSENKNEFDLSGIKDILSSFSDNIYSTLKVVNENSTSNNNDVLIDIIKNNLLTILKSIDHKYRIDRSIFDELNEIKNSLEK